MDDLGLHNWSLNRYALTLLVTLSGCHTVIAVSVSDDMILPGNAWQEQKCNIRFSNSVLRDELVQRVCEY